MQVILLQRIEKLGQMGEVVNVKAGFARNYLLPQRKALRATQDNVAHFEKQRSQLEATNLERRQEAETVAKKVEGITVVVVRQAGETGILYGSVSARDIALAVTESGCTIARDQVLIDRPIKMLGLHPVRVALHPEVIVSVTVNVAKSLEEAEIQLKAGGFVPAAAEAAQPSLDEILVEADAARAALTGETAEAGAEPAGATAEAQAPEAKAAKKERKKKSKSKGAADEAEE